MEAGAVHVEPAAVRISDLAGRPRGSGFFADRDGTVVTSHEAVDGLSRVVVHGYDGRSHLAKAAAVTPLPERDLALIRTEGLHVTPLVIGDDRARAESTPVLLRTGPRHSPRSSCWTQARLAGKTDVTYTSTESCFALPGVRRLAVPDATAVELHLDSRASGAPVVDAATGAVLGVLGTALHAPDRAGCYAVPLRDAEGWQAEGELRELLERNAGTVPGFGPDLNAAGVLAVTEASLRPVAERAKLRVPRPQPEAALDGFLASGASVAALVGRPGTGRSTELAALAGRCLADGTPAVWLRGADLSAGDGSVREAVGRALAEAGRTAAAASASDWPGSAGPDIAPAADVVARLARDAQRPLLVLLDGPEEMPAAVFAELRRWTAGTASWLRTAGARLVVACGPELWEQMGAFLPAEMLCAEPAAVLAGAEGWYGTALPPCIELGALPGDVAAAVSERYGLGAGVMAEADETHPLALRMLAEVCAATADGGDPGDGGAASGSDSAGDAAALGGPPRRSEIFSAHLDLTALRMARRLAAAEGRSADSGAVRRLAARAAGALHEAARRCLGPGRGGVSAADFGEVFPQAGGWAAAVLAEGVLEPAGDGFRFADEEFADWLQGRHLDLDTALETLVHAEAGGPSGAAVPRYRIGPVVQALLLCAETWGPEALARRLRPMAETSFADEHPEAAWWAGRLLRDVLLAVPDAMPYTHVLRSLAERIGARQESRGFGPPFWRTLPLPAARKTELLRLLLPADRPAGAGSREQGGRFLDVVGELLEAEPRSVQPLLCAWFTDRREMSVQPAGEGVSAPTVASAAQALLYTHRDADAGRLLDLLADARHPRADELLADLVHDEPAAVCRAVERWAGHERASLRAAAAEYGLCLASSAVCSRERAGLRQRLHRAAATLLGHREEAALHDSALALLLRTGDDCEPHLDAALDRLASSGSQVLAEALTEAVQAQPFAVLTAFRTRLCGPGSGADHLMTALAAVRDAGLARRATELVRDYAELRPERAVEPLTAYVRVRLRHGGGEAAGLELLVDALLGAPYAPLRAGLARVLAAAPAGPARDELLDVLLLGENDMSVLDAALDGALENAAANADGAARVETVPGPASGPSEASGVRTERARGAAGPGKSERDLVRRLGLLMARTAEGAAAFDRRVAGLAEESAGFAALLRSWTSAEPTAWTALATALPGTWTALAGPGLHAAHPALADCV